jgi:hypothetical protein
VLCTNENFEEDELMKLMGLAKNIGSNLQTNTILAFPDYNKLNHEQIVIHCKQMFSENTFANKLDVESFKTSFRR